MAGRIRDEDIAEVREKTRIDDVVSSYVTLRSAGGGNYKGLCPFHDEKSPSFNVTPSRGMYYCFGCGAGGDVIKFVMELDGLGFTETVERLAEKVGVQLRYEDGGPQRRTGPQRPRLIEANKEAATFFVAQLGSPEALPARQLLDQRGFDADAATHFGVGYAPKNGDALVRHLKDRGFTDEELSTAGLVSRNARGSYSPFRERLMWPIRDSSGDTIGFGGRRLVDDDNHGPKYLNTAETPIYKKSQVLYGLDLARREIGSKSQAVIVEGYTDVMACHLAGVTTAVASCGTAFGEEHAKVIRRLLKDHDEFRGAVIFTFDGDAAGQNAALKAFEGDQIFAGQTYVAVEPTGKDPCDLRLSVEDRAEGDALVRELIARRVPLYRFVLSSVVKRYDLDRADGRIDALREAAKLVTAIRDRSKVDAFSRELAGMLGIEPADVQREVRRAASRGVAPTAAPERAHSELPDPRDQRLFLERETLKIVLQRPDVVANTTRDVGPEDFTHGAYRAVWAAIQAAGGPMTADDGWATRLRDSQTDERLQALISSLAVEPLRREPDTAYAAMHADRLRELTAKRRIADVKSRLQRTNPVEEATEYNRMFGELVALEAHARTLRERALDSQ